MELHFARGSSELDLEYPGDRRILEELVPSLRTRDDVCLVVISGHASVYSELDLDHEPLSRARALAVRDALVERGADPAQLVVRWLGATQPRAHSGGDCAGEECDASAQDFDPDRRVMFELWICPRNPFRGQTASRGSSGSLAPRACASGGQPAPGVSPSAPSMSATPRA